MSHNKESSTNHQNHQYNNGVLQNNFSQHPSGIQPFAPNYQPPPYQTPFHLNSFNHPNPVSQQPQLHPPQPFDQPPPYNSTPQSGPQPSQPHYRAYPVIGPPNINSNKNNEYTVAIILSLVAYCFFGFVFGLIAFIFAMLGQTEVSKGNESKARDYLRASFICSAISFVVPVIIFIVIIVVSASSTTYSYSYYS